MRITSPRRPQLVTQLVWPFDDVFFIVWQKLIEPALGEFGRTFMKHQCLEQAPVPMRKKHIHVMALSSGPVDTLEFQPTRLPVDMKNSPKGQPVCLKRSQCSPLRSTCHDLTTHCLCKPCCPWRTGQYKLYHQHESEVQPCCHCLRYPLLVRPACSRMVSGTPGRMVSVSVSTIEYTESRVDIGMKIDKRREGTWLQRTHLAFTLKASVSPRISM